MISVVVPVYNTSQYLSKCINSILAQRNRDFELLLIDDGSTDDSGNICENFAKKDDRISVYHTENRGVSAARNYALERSHGEWVTFLDSDDWADDDYLTISEEQKQSDVIEKSFYIRKQDGIVLKKTQYNNSILNTKESIVSYFVNKRNNALWNKLISRRIINNVRFDEEISIGEDFLFFFHILPSIKVWAFCNIGAYNYILRQDSAMSVFGKDKKLQVKNAFFKVQMLNDCTDKELAEAAYNILYGNYIPLLYSLRKYMTHNEQERVRNLYAQMDISNLYYLSFRKKISLVIEKFLFALKN